MKYFPNCFLLPEEQRLFVWAMAHPHLYRPEQTTLPVIVKPTPAKYIDWGDAVHWSKEKRQQVGDIYNCNVAAKMGRPPSHAWILIMDEYERLKREHTGNRLKVKDFCASLGVCPRSFRYHRKKTKDRKANH